MTPVSGYIINYRSHLENWEELKIVGRRSSFSLENLKCGTKYQVTMSAFNKIGRSDVSEAISVATAGDVPSAPSFESLIRSNSTFASLNLNSWSDNGCPIMNFMVQYKVHVAADWIMLSNNIIPEQRLIIISDLMPANWYDVVMTAYSEAGSTEAQYRFGTLTLDGGK